jgi:universal stress protein A
MTTKETLSGQTPASTEESGEARHCAQKEILVPIDFSSASVKAVRFAAKFASQIKAHLTLLNVIERPGSFRTLEATAQQRQQFQASAAELRQLAERELGSETSASLVVRLGRPSEQIPNLAAQLQAELVVLARHAHHGFRRWFHTHN